MKRSINGTFEKESQKEIFVKELNRQRGPNKHECLKSRIVEVQEVSLLSFLRLPLLVLCIHLNVNTSASSLLHFQNYRKIFQVFQSFPSCTSSSLEDSFNAQIRNMVEPVENWPHLNEPPFSENESKSLTINSFFKMLH